MMGSNRLGNYYIGRLAKPTEMEAGQANPIYPQNNYRISNKILSNVPGNLVKDADFRRNKNIVRVLDYRLRGEYDNDVNNEYNALGPVEKRNQLREDLQGSLVVFNLEQRDGYYNVDNPELKTRNRDFQDDDSFDMVPYFRVQDVDYFITRLREGEIISNLRKLMSNPFDEGLFDFSHVPPYVLMQDSDAAVCAFGPLLDVDQTAGETKLFFDKGASKLQMDNPDFLYDHYSNTSDLAEASKATCYFIEESASSKIREQLKQKRTEGSDLLASPLIEKAAERMNVTSNGLSAETAILERFKKSTEHNGLYYAEADLYNFHTAMKTGNLVILAGMSGTGKSKIINCYAEALGLCIDTTYKKIPVRPFWQDDSDLLGYLDIMNNVYRPGDSGLVEFLLDAEKPENADKMHIVCFDEMNLARVEHYFSQFISVLEETEADQRIIRLYDKEYLAAMKNGETYKDTVRIGENILFVGTVNLDESTYHFSDKVLDRANVIHLQLRPFTEVAKRASHQSVNQLEHTDACTAMDYFSSRPVKANAGTFQLGEGELEFLWEIHVALQACNDKLGVGFRIVRQIDDYLSCLPKSDVLSREDALDLQILQRILTKVRGSEDEISLLAGTFDKASGSAVGGEMKRIFDQYSNLSDFTQSRKKLTSLSRELLAYGHTL